MGNTFRLKDFRYRIVGLWNQIHRASVRIK